MDEFTRLLETGGQIDAIKLVLMISFILAATGFLIVWFFGKNQGRDDSRQDSMLKTILSTQNEDREAFRKALEIFAEESRLNREERQRDYEYRFGIRTNIENALKDNENAVNDFKVVLGVVETSQSQGLAALVEAKAKMEQMIGAIKDYHKAVIESASTQQLEHLEVLGRIERAVKRIEKQVDKLIEDKVKESNNGSTERPTEE